MTVSVCFLLQAGQERFRALNRAYYRDAAGAVLVYDITSRESFVHILTWLEEVQQYASSKVPMMLIGNKCDQNRKRAVLEEEGERFAKQHGLLFFETSAVTGHNVEEVWIYLFIYFFRNLTESNLSSQFICI